MVIRIAEHQREELRIPSDPPMRVRLNPPRRSWWEGLLMVLSGLR
jgi:hypothetical protein